MGGWKSSGGGLTGGPQRTGPQGCGRDDGQQRGGLMALADPERGGGMIGDFSGIALQHLGAQTPGQVEHCGGAIFGRLFAGTGPQG